MYVIKRGTLYVAEEGQPSRYTASIDRARKFDALAAAEAAAEGEERVMKVGGQ